MHSLFFVVVSMFFFVGCALLHHVQLAEVDNSQGAGRRIEVIVSEIGINLHEAALLADVLRRDTRGSASRMAAFVAMFQYGPRTGNLVYNPLYADELRPLLIKECPSQRLSGLMSIREQNKYPLVSGEIVKVTGWCFD